MDFKRDGGYSTEVLKRMASEYVGPGLIQIDKVEWRLGLAGGGSPVLYRAESPTITESATRARIVGAQIVNPVEKKRPKSSEVVLNGRKSEEVNCLVGPSILTIDGSLWELTTDGLTSPVLRGFDGGDSDTADSPTMTKGSLFNPIVPALSVRKKQPGSESCGVQSNKGFCEQCGYIVKLDGHEVRCRQPTLLSPKFKQLAWVGDARWELFIRQWLVKSSQEMADAEKYVKNEKMAPMYPVLKQILTVGETLGSKPSIHSTAQVVEAMLAVSAVARQTLAELFYITGPERQLLWSPSLLYDEHSGYPVGPGLDGYCYLSLFERSHWVTVSELLGLFPTWERVRAKVIQYNDVSGDVNVGVVDGVAHMSVFPVRGLVKYSGKFRDMHIDEAVTVGGHVMKAWNLTEMLNGVLPHPKWPARVLFAYEQFRAQVTDLESDDWLVYGTQRAHDRMLAISLPYTVDLSVDKVRNAFRDANTALAVVRTACNSTADRVLSDSCVDLIRASKLDLYMLHGERAVHGDMHGERNVPVEDLSWDNRELLESNTQLMTSTKRNLAVVVQESCS